MEVEEKVECDILDEDKIYDEIEFMNFLQIVDKIAPNTVDFRNELGPFDYGPRPINLRVNTSMKAKLIET